MSARGLMVLGTASHVGKSLLTAALCRILRQDGYRVAPFKAQNMSLNSAATPEGGEIGRAQALQAEAAGVAPTVDMNPVLLKPTTERHSQVVVLGKIWDELSAADYHRRRILELAPTVHEAYARLARRYDIVVLEGAGSPAEINLRDSDIVNMPMARAADARCVLVGDIDRGGVFAALVGTLSLLGESDRARVIGTVVNRFRGDPALFADGIALLEMHTAKPCLGVVPYLPAVGLEEEDAVGFADVPLATRPTWRDAREADRRLRVAVVAWPQLANVTDFDALGCEPSVEVAYVAQPGALCGADVVVLPGTKSTLRALRWLRERGFAQALAAHATRGLVVGICGGMQALGNCVDDPYSVEGGGREPGLRLLSIATTLAAEKVTERARGATYGRALFGSEGDVPHVDGYEIHVGVTTYEGATPFARIVRESDGASVDDGAVSADGRVIGTYLHGLFTNDAFRAAFIATARNACGLAPASAYAAVGARREALLDRLADHVRAALDVPRMLALAEIGR